MTKTVFIRNIVLNTLLVCLLPLPAHANDLLDSLILARQNIQGSDGDITLSLKERHMFPKTWLEFRG